MPEPMQDNPPGATSAADGSDNHLRLNPNDPQWQDDLMNWEDGNTYIFKEVKVRQISPGEFEVVAATPTPGPAEPTGGADYGGEDEGEMEGMEPGAAPAMRRMMRRRGQ